MMSFFSTQRSKGAAKSALIAALAVMASAALFPPFIGRVVLAAGELPTENITNPGFRLLVCDGPTLPPKAYALLVPNAPADFEKKYGHAPPYVECDFNAVMKEVQHLINIAIILGVLAAIAGFCYSGFLLITGNPAKIKRAKTILPKLVWGFIIMLAAWFIVYQLILWLTGNSGLAALLGGNIK